MDPSFPQDLPWTVVPEDLPFGGDLELKVEIGGVSSQGGVTIAVEGSSEPPAPAAPSVSASTLSSSAIRLSWITLGGNLTGYRLDWRVLPSGGFIEIASPGAQAVFYDDFGLASSTRYGYRIRAENASRLSPCSSEAQASTSAALPAAPTNLPGW